MTALSHVSLVIGLGSSCSQPLLAKRPSRTAGSFLKLISNPCVVEIWLKPDPTAAKMPGETEACRGEKAVFGMTPSWSHLRQFTSNSGEKAVVAGEPCARGIRLKPDFSLQNSRTTSYADCSGRSLMAARTSCADLPP